MTPFDEVLRVEGGRVLATLIRFTGDIGLAEDALQDAVLVALQRWPETGMPRNPGAWLTTAARNKALDRMRRESKRSSSERDAVSIAAPNLRTGSDPSNPSDTWDAFDSSMIRDDQLRLLFTCCHPALAPDARVALALRTICRLSTAEIARVHLVAESTIGQRISRAKRKIAVAGIPYRIPEDHELPDRLSAVLVTVYAVFVAGHHSPVGQLDARTDLADEGVRLARLLVALMPDEPECIGLLALVLATHARRCARLGSDGELVLMENQDRSRWHHDEIAEAASLVERVLPRRRIGPYQLQAAISCLHGLAPDFDRTDWKQIAELYSMLEVVQPSAVVRVNRAVAVSYASSPAAGLAMLDTIEESHVAQWHLYWSTKAAFLARVGKPSLAVQAFDRALACEMNDSDRRFLVSRREELAAPE